MKTALTAALIASTFAFAGAASANPQADRANNVRKAFLNFQGQSQTVYALTGETQSHKAVAPQDRAYPKFIRRGRNTH